MSLFLKSISSSPYPVPPKHEDLLLTFDPNAKDESQENRIQNVYLNSIEQRDNQPNIVNSDLKIRWQARDINQKHIPLRNFEIYPDQMMQLAPYLTFVDARDAFDGWSLNEIDLFLNACSNSIVSLLINNPKVVKIPPLPNCEQFESSCLSLKELPELPKCQRPRLECCPFLEKNIDPIKLIERIRQIRDLEFRYSLLSQIIEHHKLPLQSLKLTKVELIKLASYLTYADCTHLISMDWNPQEIKIFIQNLSTKVATLMLNTSSVHELPDLPNCEVLDCSYCYSLDKLPLLP